MKDKYLKAVEYYWKLADKHGISAASDGRNDHERENITKYVQYLESQNQALRDMLKEELRK